MDKKDSNQNNKSMFIYTGLIFVVALVLIILAFFGKINRPITAEPTATPAPTTDISDTIDKFKDEMLEMNNRLTAYEHLVKANAYAAQDMKDEAAAELANVAPGALTEEQRVLYDQVTEKINQ